MMRTMWNLTLPLAAILLLAVFAVEVQAYPGYGGTSCTGCHGGSADGMEVANYDLMSGPLGGDLLPTYQVFPGDSVDLSFLVTEAGSGSLVELHGLDDGGLLHTVTPKDFTLVDAGAGSWRTAKSNVDGVTYSLGLNVGGGAVENFYRMESQLVGKLPSMATDPASFYVQVVPEPGTLALLAMGLGALGLLGWRRRRIG